MFLDAVVLASVLAADPYTGSAGTNAAASPEQPVAELPSPAPFESEPVDAEVPVVTPPTPEGELEAPVPEPASEHAGVGAPLIEPEGLVTDEGEGAASSFSVSMSTVVDRSEFETTHPNANGTKSTAMSEVPMNVFREGEWVEVSKALTPDGKGGFVGADDLVEPEFTDQVGE